MKKLLISIFCLFLSVSSVYAIQYVKSLPLSTKVLSTIVSVGTSATALPATAMVGRSYVKIQNVGSVVLYIGDSNVTADTTSTGGTQIFPYGSWYGEYDDSVVIYGIVASSTCNTVVEEGK